MDNEKCLSVRGKNLVVIIGISCMVACVMTACGTPLAVDPIDQIQPTPVAPLSSYTSTPTLPISTPTAILPATTEYVESCASTPVNFDDGVTINLSQNKWYVVDDYNNRLEIPEHHIIVLRGPGTVSAVPERGQRAWECSDQAIAQLIADQTAIFIKRNNPTNKVYGPDGQEIILH